MSFEHDDVIVSFEHDVIVTCPNMFNIDYVIPAESDESFGRTYAVHISDSYRTIRLTVYRPAADVGGGAYEQSSSSTQSEPS